MCALTALISLSTAGITTALGLGLLTGTLSFGFFAAKSIIYRPRSTNDSPKIEQESESQGSIENFFQKYFFASSVLSESEISHLKIQ